MNKSDLVKAMAEKSGLSVKDSTAAYDAMVEAVTEALKQGDKVQLAGYGTYEVRQRPARVGINPRTKEKVDIAASNVPALKFSSAYKKLFN